MPHDTEGPRQIPGTQFPIHGACARWNFADGERSPFPRVCIAPTFRRIIESGLFGGTRNRGNFRRPHCGDLCAKLDELLKCFLALGTSWQAALGDSSHAFWRNARSGFEIRHLHERFVPRRETSRLRADEF